MKSEAKSLLNRKYVGQVEKSHLFFTAPHSKTLQRGGKDYNEDVQVHKRESYAAFLACDFARGTGKNSFLFWGKSK
jgi:tRNA(Leu) C34 or U34 (ribose-2'-O)-methylase TrmL